MTIKQVVYDWGGVNVAIFQAINHTSGEFLRPLAYAGSIAGDYWSMPLLLCVLLALARNSTQRSDFLTAAQLRLQVRCLIIGFLIAWLSVGLLKIGFDFPRPIAVLGAEVRIIGKPHDTYSLPSGHTAYAALVLVVLWSLIKPMFRTLLITFVVWVGWSRVASGAHFPADVVGRRFDRNSGRSVSAASCPAVTWETQYDINAIRL